MGIGVRSTTWWPVFVLAGGSTGEVEAQSPDVLAEPECPGCAAALEFEPSLAGTWSSPLTAADDATWTLEDFLCLAACTPEARTAATALLRDPANARRPTIELYEETVNLNARQATGLLTPAARAAAPQPHTPTRSPRFACDPHGFAAQVVSPLPLEIVRRPGGFVLHYEEFGARRYAALDGGTEHHADQVGAFGRSKARFEDGTLVVETSGIPVGTLHDWFGGALHSDKLQATERYSTSDDGDWLRLVLTLEDPETLREPLVLTKSWRRARGVEIASHGCNVMSGQLENVFADYVDPRKLDRRRGL